MKKSTFKYYFSVLFITIFSSLCNTLSAQTAGDIITIFYDDGVNTHYLAIEQKLAEADQQLRTVTIPNADKHNYVLPNSCKWIVLNNECITNYVYDRTLSKVYGTTDVAIGGYPSGSLGEYFKHTITYDGNEIYFGWLSAKYICYDSTKPINAQFYATTKPLLFDKNKYAHYRLEGHALANGDAINFHHTGGAMNSLDAKGRQKTHEMKYTFYAKPGDKVLLKNSVRGEFRYPNAFYRWYDYSTDKWNTLFDANLDLGSTFTRIFANGYGRFVSSNRQPDLVYYKMGNKPITIAVDVSNYADYSIQEAEFYEPTLSYRRIYDIRPASEIAHKLDSVKNLIVPLEVYNIQAPAGKEIHIGPKMSWTGTNTNNYFIDKSSPTPIDGKWFRNNLSLSIGPNKIIDDRLIKYTVPNNGMTDVVELRSQNGHIIARFNITGVKLSEHGPVVGDIKGRDQVSLNKDFQFEGERRFDFDVSHGNAYQRPLSWIETSYGFTYTTGQAGTNKTRMRGFADCGEYMLLQDANEPVLSTFDNIQAPWMSNANTFNHGGKGKGYFLYCDLTEDPGLIAKLDVNGVFCPGTSMFVSAYVANLKSQKYHPNITFNLVGYDLKGNEVTLGSYTTGNITQNSGEWMQVFFETKIPNNIDPKGQFTLDVYNTSYYNSADEVAGEKKGTYFAIDDIQIFSTKPTGKPLQTMLPCGTEDGKNLAVLCFDYLSKFTVSGDQKIYYQWTEENNGNILQLDYINKESSNPYGFVVVNKDKTLDEIKANKANYKYYSDIDAFLNSVDFVTEGAAFYSSKKIDGVERPLLYIIHKSDKFKELKEYTAYTSINKVDFDNECGSSYTMKVMPRNQLLFDNVPIDLSVLTYLKSGIDYTLKVRSFGVNAAGNMIQSDNTLCDWVQMSDGYDEAKIAAAINHFRKYYPTGTNLGSSTGEYTQADIDLLKKYVGNGTLTLSAKERGVRVKDDGTFVHYLIFPFANDAFTVCPTKLSVKMASGLPMSLGKTDYDALPQELKGQPCIYRIPESEIATFAPVIRVNSMKSGFKLKSAQMELFDSNDPKFTKLVVGYNITNPIFDQIKVNDVVTFEPTGISMRGGYYYTFRGHSTNQKMADPCQFTIYVVPNIVKWAPDENPVNKDADVINNNYSWHNDDNWKQTVGYGKGFIPTSKTNVIIPTATAKCPAPEALIVDADGYENGVNVNLKHQYGVEDYSCQNVFLCEGAMLPNQHKLKYDKVWFDLHLNQNDWNLVSMPIKSVVSGDFYIPKKGDTIPAEQFNFQPLDTVDSRYTHKIQQKVYNLSVDTMTINGSKPIVPIAKWSIPTNILNMEYKYGYGYAVKYEHTLDSTSQPFIRFPKNEIEYYYFDANTDTELSGPDWVGLVPPVKVNRPDLGKLFFIGNTTITINTAANSEIFIIGNPFVANLKVSEFYDVNQSIFKNKFYYHENGILQGTDKFTAGTVMLAPMSAMLVQSKSPINMAEIKFTTAMIDTKVVEPDKIEPKRNVKARYAPDNNVNDELKIIANRKGAKSMLVLEQSPVYSSGYLESEDIELLMLGPDITPISLYTFADNQSIMRSRVPSLNMIPILLNIADSIKTDYFMLSFDGFDNLVEPTYLYDSKLNNYTEIHDNIDYQFESVPSDQFRYYVTRRKNIPSGVDDIASSVQIYSKDLQAEVVSSSLINSINVYDISGKILFSIDNVSTNCYTLNLNPGIYLFEVQSEIDKVNQKVWIK